MVFKMDQTSVTLKIHVYRTAPSPTMPDTWDTTVLACQKVWLIQ